MSLTFEDVRKEAINIQRTNEFVVKFATEFLSLVKYPESDSDGYIFEYDKAPIQGEIYVHQTRLLEIIPYSDSKWKWMHMYSKNIVPLRMKIDELAFVSALGKPTFIETFFTSRVPDSVREFWFGVGDEELKQNCLALIRDIRSSTDISDQVFNMMLSGVTMQDLANLCLLPFVDSDVYHLKYSHVRAAIFRDLYNE